MVEEIGGRYTSEQLFWLEFEEALKDAWVLDPPKRIVNLPDPIYYLADNYADIF